MSEEILFNFIENAINVGVDKLQNEQHFKPYALTLNSEQNVLEFSKEGSDDDVLYENIVLALKDEVTCKDIEIIAVVALVDVPEHYKSEHDRAIRVHIEQKSLKDEKIGGRFIYAPYKLYKIENRHEVELFEPFSVGFIAEIFN